MKNQNSGTWIYTKIGDYYIPDLILDNQPNEEVGIYSRMRKQYLKEHHPGRYSYMLLYGTLYPHLLEIDEAAQGYPGHHDLPHGRRRWRDRGIKGP